MEKKVVNFYHIDTALPDYKSKYEGFYVLDVNNDLYIGTSSGWKELTGSAVGDLSGLNTEEKGSLVDAINDVNEKIGNINDILDNIIGSTI